MKTKYKDLTIWITGASSGIGEALSNIAFAKRGAVDYSQWTR
jgi:NADP-dependent 3-hydroxy acid dehydrogenase YdfG